jgi:hypothetical protein
LIMPVDTDQDLSRLKWKGIALTELPTDALETAFDQASTILMAIIHEKQRRAMWRSKRKT